LKTRLFIYIALTALAGMLLYVLRDLWSLRPFENYESYSNIFQVTTDARENLYTITDSKKILRKVDDSGKLVYAIPSSDGNDARSIRLYDSVAADGNGYAYALVTILDENGLHVLGEQILRIAPDGSQRQVIYEAAYDPSENLLRVGKIQSLSVADEELYFFLNEEAKASLMMLPASAAAATVQPGTAASIEMPANRYLKELTGSDPGRMFYSSKRGSLYMITEQSVTRLYPSGTEASLNFPVDITTEDHDRLYFIDYHDEAVYRIDLNRQGSSPVPVVTANQLLAIDPASDWADITDIHVANGKLSIAMSDRIIRFDANGGFVAMHDGYRIPFSIIARKFGYWLLILASAVFVLLTLRSLYVDVLQRKVYLLLKQLAAILPIVLVSMIILSYTVYTSFSKEMKESTYNQLKLLAANGKFLIDGDHLEKLVSPRDYMSEDYNAIKERISEVFSRSGEDRDGLYNTIYRYMNGSLYLIMDDDDSVTMFQPFPLSEENLLVLDHGAIVVGEWEDASGEWLYALGPIYNGAGEVIGIYETGKDMAGMQRSNLEIMREVMKIFAWIGAVLVLAITLMTFLLLSSIRKLRRNVNLFANGEWDARVNIRSRDEVEELGERFNMMAQSIRRYIQEVTKLSQSYFRFVPQQFLKVLGKTNMTQVQLGEQQKREMTILVCNMRRFHEFSMKLTTEENFRFINSFLKTFGPVIREFGGFISRYLGPGMLTMFPNDTASAVRAALKLRATLNGYNDNRANSGYEPIEIGVAIHTGDVMLGIIGEEQRMEGSVVSQHVQLTQDLEKLSGKLGVSILLTADALQSLRQHPGQYRKLGAFQIDEDQPPIELFDLFEADPVHLRRLKQETKAQFEAAVEAFRQGRFYDAREGFVAVVKKNQYDLAARMYFFESDRYFQQGASADWNNALRVS
jgi:class 3 adenylate cyclase/HAMP domain-containing protein